jgi:RNA polymerase subunit RPABC4/transcription elongation factor Spt4
MSEVLEKCAVCLALLDEEDLFCPNCGREAPNRVKVAGDRPATTHSFACKSCGASMSYDAEVRTLRCPFCGSHDFAEESDAPSLAASRAVPFAIDRQQAETMLRQWLGRGFWRPGDLAQQAVVNDLTAVYVPYWLFSARTHTYWSADTSQTPPGARGDWFPLTGEHRGEYTNVLIGGSSALTPAETAAIRPFQMEAARPPSEVLGRDGAAGHGIVVEQFRVQRKFARPLAQQGLEDAERRACAVYVPGRSRNVKVNVMIEGLTGEPVLLPVWVMAYRYRDDVFRFLLNGQTGQATGNAPVSRLKIAGAVAIGVGVALIALIVFLLIAAAGAR